MPLKTVPFDGAQYAETPQAEFELLADAASTGDADYIRHALNTVARARGMSAIARDAGISRSALFDAYLAEGGAATEALLEIFRALGCPAPEEVASAAE